MRGAWEEVVALQVGDSVFFEKQGDVASLSDGVAAEVDDARWCGFEEFGDDVGMEAGTRWVEDDDFVRGDVVECLFGGGENGGSVFAESGDVLAHFTHGVLVEFDERDVVAADGQADGADAGVEVEDFCFLHRILATEILQNGFRAPGSLLRNFSGLCGARFAQTVLESQGNFLVVCSGLCRCFGRFGGSAACRRQIDPFCHVTECLLVHRDVDLEKAFGGVAERCVEDGVGENDVTKAGEAFSDDARWAFMGGVDDFATLSRECGGFVVGDELVYFVLDVELPDAVPFLVAADEQSFEIAGGDGFGAEEVADFSGERIDVRVS